MNKINSGQSVRAHVVLENDTLRKLRVIAERHDRSFAAECRLALKTYVALIERKDGPTLAPDELTGDDPAG